MRVNGNRGKRMDSERKWFPKMMCTKAFSKMASKADLENKSSQMEIDMKETIHKTNSLVKELTIGLMDHSMRVSSKVD
jgi:hypothetical protein